MDLSFSEKDRAFQAEVRSFLDEAWPQEMRDKQVEAPWANFPRKIWLAGKSG